METIYKHMKIEEFLYKVRELAESNTLTDSINIQDNYLIDIANTMRYKETNAFKIERDSTGLIKIQKGVYVGNKAEILSQYEDKFEVRIEGDKYKNVVVIDINDVACTVEKAKITYVLD